MPWQMPAEWQPHERTWMAWPSNGYTLGETPEEHFEARSAWAAVANAIARFEPVTMLCEEQDLELARAFLDKNITIISAQLNDAWMRDIGPTFVKASDGQVAAVNWVFNGWGGQSWARWDKDSQVARFIGEKLEIPILNSNLINEGGGIAVNGSGTVLLTETVQLGEGRNSNLSREEVENELHEKLGTNQAIWIQSGLTRDYGQFGTRGHIDIVACFANETTILYHNQENPKHPDFAVSQQVRKTLEQFAEFTLVPIAAPTTLSDHEGFVDYSYINHYIVNGGVILCGFDDPNDKRAIAALQLAYPGREIVLVDARAIFARGGGIHCITQQQPA